MAPQDGKIEDILNSLDGLEKAAANPFLYQKIKLRMESRAPETPRAGITRWALALSLIVILNVVSWFRMNSGNADSSGELRTVAAEYGFTSVTYQY